MVMGMIGQSFGGSLQIEVQKEYVIFANCNKYCISQAPKKRAELLGKETAEQVHCQNTARPAWHERSIPKENRLVDQDKDSDAG